MNLREELAVYKFDLIKEFLSSKSNDKKYYEELRNKAILLDSIMKRTKLDININCENEVKEIKDFILKNK